MIFKPSIYNILHHHPEAGWLLYNSLSGALVGIEEQYIQLFHLDQPSTSLSLDASTLSNKQQDILKELKKGGFVLSNANPRNSEN